jgi:hypothetical protein
LGSVTVFLRNGTTKAVAVEASALHRQDQASVLGFGIDICLQGVGQPQRSPLPQLICQLNQMD